MRGSVYTGSIWRIGQALACLMLLLTSMARAERLDGYTVTGAYNEQVKEFSWDPDARVLINAPSPEKYSPDRPTLLVLYALPNGNSIEWTIGRKLHEGMDWHFDIQHIGAQTRLLRENMPDRNLVVAYLEASPKSWPTWRKNHENSSALIVRLVEQLRSEFDEPDIVLTGHSGGGSFTFGFLNGVEEMPAYVTRIAFLDSNYGFDAEEGHAEKLISWLKGGAERQLVVIAYDDRYVEYNGKRIVSETGGTWRATRRMLFSFLKEYDFDVTDTEEIERYVAPQIEFLRHRNPEKKILHTVLVEKNGYIYGLTAGTELENEVATFWDERAYSEYIEDVNRPEDP